MIPFQPMSPILMEDLPIGEQWRYQLKWDGIRLLSHIQNGDVTLYTKNMQNVSAAFPDLVIHLQKLQTHCLLDGEAIVMHPDKGRPDFHLMLRRLQQRKPSSIQRAAQIYPVTFAVFDILSINDADLRSLDLLDRYKVLYDLIPTQTDVCLIPDLFVNGDALWQWVNEHQWEGVVSKSIYSPYSFGEKHSDWYKTKVKRIFEVSIPGYMLNEGRLASLIMVMGDSFCGKISAGLNELLRKQLLDLPIYPIGSPSPIKLPIEVQKNQLRWLKQPIEATVTCLELTDNGIFRHPKIVELRGVKQ